MRRVLQDWKGDFRIGGITINNLRYADDIVLIAETEEELQDLVNRLVRNNLVLNASKTKVMTNTTENMNVKVNDIVLEQVDVFQYLGANITNHGNNCWCNQVLNQVLNQVSGIKSGTKVLVKVTFEND